MFSISDHQKSIERTCISWSFLREKYINDAIVRKFDCHIQFLTLSRSNFACWISAKMKIRFVIEVISQYSQ